MEMLLWIIINTKNNKYIKKKIDSKLFALTILKLNVHHIFATNESTVQYWTANIK